MCVCVCVCVCVFVCVGDTLCVCVWGNAKKNSVMLHCYFRNFHGTKIISKQTNKSRAEEFKEAGSNRTKRAWHKPFSMPYTPKVAICLRTYQNTATPFSNFSNIYILKL